MSLILSLAAGKALDFALKGTGVTIKGLMKKDPVERVLIILHADYGDRIGLKRKEVEDWSQHENFRTEMEALLSGTLGAPKAREQLPAAFERLLGHLSENARTPLARVLAEGAVVAAPWVATSEGQGPVLLANRAEQDKQDLLAAITGEDTDAEGGNPVSALLRGPLREAGLQQEADQARELEQQGDFAGAAAGFEAIGRALDDRGFKSVAETYYELAADQYKQAGNVEQQRLLLREVADSRVIRGTSLADTTVRRLQEALSSEDQWVAHALQARLHPLDDGAEDTLRRAIEAAGGDEQLEWRAAYVDALALREDYSTILDVTADLGLDAFEASPGLSLQLDRLDALAEKGRESEAETGWLAITRWADAEAQPHIAGIVWQRRGRAAARRGDLAQCIDAYQRAMGKWSALDGYDEQVADAFYSTHAAAMLNAEPIPSPELRTLAAEMRGTADTPVARADRLSEHAAGARLNGWLPDAHRGYVAALAIHRRSGSLQGEMETRRLLGELYTQSGHRRAAFQNLLACGQQKEAVQLSKNTDSAVLEAVLGFDGPRWSRTANMAVLAGVGSRLSEGFLATISEAVIAEAEQEVEPSLQTNPTMQARRALSAIVFALPEHLRSRVVEIVRAEAGTGFIDHRRLAFRALMNLTSLGISDESETLVEGFLEDPYNLRIDESWLAENIPYGSPAFQRIREAAIDGSDPALVVMLLSGVPVDREVAEACTRTAERGARLTTIEEKTEDGEHTMSVGMGFNMETLGLVAREAEDTARGALFDRMMQIVTDAREPEGNRASAVGAIFNMAPALSDDQIRSAVEAIEPLMLGDYQLSQWDHNLDDPLSPFQISFHTPGLLRAGALDAYSRIVELHGHDSEKAQQAINRAFDEGPDSLIASALEAAARLPKATIPVPIEAALAHPEEDVRVAALKRWGAVHEGVPDSELGDALRRDPSPRVRHLLLGLSRDRKAWETVSVFTDDPDAIIRGIARDALAGQEAGLTS